MKQYANWIVYICDTADAVFGSFEQALSHKRHLIEMNPDLAVDIVRERVNSRKRQYTELTRELADYVWDMYREDIRKPAICAETGLTTAQVNRIIESRR